MRIKIPKSLAGGSLLQAHSWVKSNMARHNPGVSTDNYILRNSKGEDITLSDIVTNPDLDEVLIIQGVRSNPSSYPVPIKDYNYPSYSSKPRIGNKIADLIAEDIEPSMVERLSVQMGTFAALNTIVRLTYLQNRATDFTDPKVADLLQRMANANQQIKLRKGTRTNPGRPFYASAANEMKGVLSPQQAIGSFMQEEFGTPVENEQFLDDFVSKTRIIQEYDLDNAKNITDFVDDVLTPYIVVATANMGFLKAMQKYRIDVEKALSKRRSTPEKMPFYDHPDYKKFLSYIPTKAEEFYEGTSYGIVAHPIFSRETLATAAMDKKTINRLFEVVASAPKGLEKYGTADGEIRELRPTVVQSIRRFLGLEEGYILDNMRLAQINILADTEREEHLNNLRAIYDIDPTEFTDEIIKRTENNFLVIREIGGFRPTPPPYWPRPIVFSIMDVLKRNIEKIISDENLNLDLAFAKLIKQPQTVRYETLINLSAAPVVHDFSLGTLDRILYEIMNPGAGVGVTAFHARLDSEDATEPNWDNENERGISRYGVINTNQIARRAKWLLEEILVNDYAPVQPNGNTIDANQWWNNQDHIRAVRNQILQYIADHEQPASLLSYNDQNVVSLLSLFMSIEEVCRTKYNYTVTENERAFILFLLQQVLIELYHRTDGPTFGHYPEHAPMPDFENMDIEGLDAEQAEAYALFNFSLHHMREIFD